MQKKQIHRISPIQRYQATGRGGSVFIVATIYSLKCLVSNNKKCETCKETEKCGERMVHIEGKIAVVEIAFEKTNMLDIAAKYLKVVITNMLTELKETRFKELKKDMI